MPASRRAGDALSEVPVDRAPPEIAAIYHEIADLSGIPLPALIWRHLATLQGVLPKVWAALRPLYVSGLVQEAAWSARHTVLAGRPCDLTRAVLEQASLGPEAIDAYGLVLASYNRANPVNFIGVRLLLSTIDASGGNRLEPQPLPDVGPWTPPSPIVGLPPMTPPSSIDPATRTLIDAIVIDPDIDRAQVVPSLYRHLVGWPPLVQAIHDELVPRMRAGELAALREEVASALAREADRLSPFLPQIPGLGAEPGLQEALVRFSGLIPEMVAIGGLLTNGLAASE